MRMRMLAGLAWDLDIGGWGRERLEGYLKVLGLGEKNWLDEFWRDYFFVCENFVCFLDLIGLRVLIGGFRDWGSLDVVTWYLM